MVARRHGNVNRRGSSLMEIEGFTGKEPTAMDRDSDSYRWTIFPYFLRDAFPFQNGVVPCEKVSQNVDPSEKRFFVTNYQ